MSEINIIKSFRSDAFAKARSQGGYEDKANWQWGIDDEGVLYGKGSFSGVHFEKDWHRADRLPFCVGIEEMILIVESLVGLVKPYR